MLFLQMTSKVTIKVGPVVKFNSELAIGMFVTEVRQVELIQWIVVLEMIIAIHQIRLFLLQH